MTPPSRYEKPRITRIPLAAEEAVLTVCKAGVGSLRTQGCNNNNGGCTNQGHGS